MIDASTLPAEKLRFTTRMIRDQALARGWKVWLYYLGSSHMQLQRTDGRVLELYSSTPLTTSFIAASRADDKFLTHVLLKKAGLPMPETFLAESFNEAKERAEMLFSEGKKVVIKPLDASHGRGVTVELESTDRIFDAFKYAQDFSKSVIIQESISQPTDIRLVCINFKYVAGLERMPARVKGNGVHTIEQLIDLENQSERRGRDYLKELNMISKSQAESYLGDKIKTIPAQGEYVSVLGTANVGTGGETKDITDHVPDWLRDMAEKAAYEMKLPVCGVDFLVASPPKKEDSLGSLEARVIEINKCPSLFIHETPTYGKPRPVTAAFLDYLNTL